MHPEKFEVDKIQNAYQPLFPSTGLILWNIMKTAQDIYTITIKQIVRLRERMYFEKIILSKFKMAANQPLFTFTWLLFGKPC